MAKKPQRKPDSARLAKLIIQRRTLALLLVFGVASFLALFAKAYDLTINQYDEMKERASNQQMRSTVITASRGSIYDRSGTILAMSASADNVFLDPNAIQRRADELDLARLKKLDAGLAEGESLPMSGQAYKDMIAQRLAEILEIDEEKIRDEMARTNYMYAVIKRRVEKSVSDQIREFISSNDSGAVLQGVHLETDSKRYYPYSALASHVIGFLDPDNRGAYGLEALYDEELEGSAGLAVTAQDGRSSEIMFQYEQYYDAQDGHSLQLTLDSVIQSYVERGLEDMVAKYGAKNGATGIVMDPNTGGILAIASSPTYDINDHHGIYDPLLQAELAEVEEENPPAPGEEHSDAYWEALGLLQNRQWRNKAVNDTYEPGSTAKILTLSMALEEGAITPSSTFQCGGSIPVSGEPIGCSNKNGHGHQVLKEAVGNSCNPAFISIGLSLFPPARRL